MSDGISFTNMDSYRGNSYSKFGLTFKQIVLMHINRCVLNGSVEWHGGYWQEKSINNAIEKYYIQNSREVYYNSIRTLRAILLGYFDEKMKEQDKSLMDEYNDSYEKYNDLENKNKEDTIEWNNFKVDWSLRMFEQLILLGKRLNFFEEESSEEEV